MKVLDLQCEHGHPFEAWFASEQAFQEQSLNGMLQCPMCGSASVAKKLSAPRLNLSGARQAPSTAPTVPPTEASAFASAWLEVSRRLVASSQDVGDRFAEEARKMHYGETEERAIRGKSTLNEVMALHEEGIAVMPIAVPEHLNKPLH
jgi:hypothetical protein